MSKIDKLLSSESWQASVRVVEDFLKGDDKLDSLLKRHIQGLNTDIVRRIQYLSYGVVRNLGRLQSALRSAVNKPPKKRLQAMLLVGMFEWLDADESSRPQVVHHAVEQAKRKLSRAEGRFVNAVMRRIPKLGLGLGIEDEAPGKWSDHYSHPKWMIERWLEQLGEENTRRLLKWNQQVPKIYAWSPVSKTVVPSDWVETKWSEFYEIQGADWESVRAMLADGKTYIQDPSTRLGAALLEGMEIRSVLDLCAAPGGKSIQLQRYIGAEDGLLVSVDLMGVRFDRLKENLSRYSKPGARQLQVAADVLTLTADELPQAEYDAVYVDVPCSNTGVLQRRPDVKWRQSEAGVVELVKLQLALLRSASRFVKPDGCLLYSTCSVEATENEQVIDTFLQIEDNGFSLESSVRSLPWETGHDGAGAFLLRRAK